MQDRAIRDETPAIKILLVDDSPSDRAIFCRFLNGDPNKKYHFTEVEKVSAAIESIELEAPDCILLDYDLPDADGTELIKLINEKYGKNSLPVVMLSASGTIETAVEAMRSGAQDFLTKSRATAGDLVRAVQNAIEKIRLISDKKFAEKELERLLVREKELREEAERANHSKDEFLAVLSHELRTPLNAMSGWAKMLNLGILDAAKSKKAVEVIERNIRLQNTLIEDLLDISRIISGKIKIEPTIINFCRIVSDALETARFSAEAKNLTIEHHFQNDVCSGMGDALRLQQVVGNLLNNAIKFTPANGIISASLSVTGNSAKISISDNGIGIERELLPHVFERFRQADGSTKRQFGGLGLGLAIAKSLVEMHGGTISADSFGENQGSTFSIELPILQTPENNSRENSPSEFSLKESKPLENIKIIVVEDQADSLELLSFVLKTNGAQVFPFISANKALDEIEKINADLLISDISMSEMDGYDFIQKVRELPSAKNKFIPAIAMTAYTSIEDRSAVLSAGFQMHIAKPINVEEIPKNIKQLLENLKR